MIESLKIRFAERFTLKNYQSNKDKYVDAYAAEKADSRTKKLDGLNDAKAIKDAISLSKRDELVQHIKGQAIKNDELSKILEDINILNDILDKSKNYKIYDRLGNLEDIQNRILELIKRRNELDSQIARLNEIISRIKTRLQDSRLSQKDLQTLRDELAKLEDKLSRMEKERINIRDFLIQLEILLRQLREDIKSLESIQKPDVKPDVRPDPRPENPNRPLLPNMAKFMPIIGVVALAGVGALFNPTDPPPKPRVPTTTVSSEDGCPDGTKQGYKDGVSAGFSAGLAEATRQYNLWVQQYSPIIPTEDSSNDDSGTIPTSTSNTDSNAKSNNNSNNNSNK